MTTELLRTDSEAFARRLANLLREHRRNSGQSLGQLAKSSSGRFNRGTLRQVESGSAVLGASDLTAIAELYAVDLSAILPARVALEVEPHGVLRTAGVTTVFDPTDESSLLTAYLRLVRRLRDAERAPAVDLRRVDIEILATALDQPGEIVVDRLGVLMGATRKQRGALVGSFAAGAAIIGLGSIMIMTSGGSPQTTDRALGVGSAPPDELAMVDDEVMVDDSSSSAIDLDDDTSPISDPVSQEEIDGPLLDGGSAERSDVADGTGVESTGIDSTGIDSAGIDSAGTTDNGAGDVESVGLDLPDDDAETSESGGDTANGDVAVDESAADEPAMTESLPQPDAEPEPDPMVEREPVMTPMPMPDPIVGRDPVMTPMPAPSDPVATRGPVMVPMPAPEVDVPKAEIGDDVVAVDVPATREVSA